MGFAFNPFTGNFDLKGSGGGASYIDGEVQNFSALPETLGTPPVDSAYLVREPEGTWLLARKPAGIYIRTANTGVRADDWTHASAFPDVFSDAAFTVYSDLDATANVQLDLSGITTGTTRTLTVPDASGTIARTEDFAAPPAIGNTTPAAGSFTTLAANNGTLTASAPVLDLAQTWNADAVTFTGLRFSVTNTASATASLLINTTVGSNDQFFVSAAGRASARSFSFITGTVTDNNFEPVFTTSASGVIGVRRRDTGAINYVLIGNDGSSRGLVINTTTQGESFLGFHTASATSLGAATLRLHIDAADTLAQRRTTNAQEFRIYNTFTSATNHERGFLRWSSNVFQIGTEKGSGGGTARALEFRTDNVARLTLGEAGGVTLNSGNLVLTDNTGSETATFDAQAKLTDDRTYDLPDRSGTMVVSDTSAGSGSDVVNNIVSLTQAEYDAIGSPDAATLFLITDP